jgi:hypothetical protein
MNTFKNEQEIYNLVLNKGIAKIEDIIILNDVEFTFESGSVTERKFINQDKSQSLVIAVDAGWPYISLRDIRKTQ